MAITGTVVRPEEIVEVQGHKMILDDVDSLRLRERGIHEPGVTALVREKVKPGDVVLDIGAHIGYYTLIFAELVGPRGQVLAFEPRPDNVKLLCENIKLNKCFEEVGVFQWAVWDKWDEVKLWLNSKNKADNRCWNPERPWRWVWVQTIDLDYPAFNPVNFIKMDIQGAEYRALLGMQGLLEDNPQVKIVSEFSPAMLEACGPGKAIDFPKLLEKLGFNMSIIHKTGELEPVSPTTLLNKTPKSRFRNIYCERRN